jgi:putative ABC transport system ATP-binding protein
VTITHDPTIAARSNRHFLLRGGQLESADAAGHEQSDGDAVSVVDADADADADADDAAAGSESAIEAVA